MSENMFYLFIDADDDDDGDDLVVFVSFDIFCLFFLFSLFFLFFVLFFLCRFVNKTYSDGRTSFCHFNNPVENFNAIDRQSQAGRTSSRF